MPKNQNKMPSRMRSTPRRRRGSFLVQQTIVIGISSAMILIVASLIHQSLHFGSRIRKDGNSRTAMYGLVRQFRNDVHSAVNAVQPTKESIELQLIDGGKVKYRVDGSSVVREVFPSDSSSNTDEQNGNADAVDAIDSSPAANPKAHAVNAFAIDENFEPSVTVDKNVTYLRLVWKLPPHSESEVSLGHHNLEVKCYLSQKSGAKNP